MNIEGLTQYCKEGGWRFVTKPDNILTFDNPDILFVSKQNYLVGCVVATAKEQQNRNYLLRRLYRIRASYPDNMQLVLLNGEKITLGDELVYFCNSIGVTDDSPHLINNLIADGKENKQLFTISKKLRAQVTERAHQIMCDYVDTDLNLEKTQNLYAFSWMNQDKMSSEKIYQCKNGCIVHLTSSKDPQILTVLNYMDIELYKHSYGFNMDYMYMPKWGIVNGSFTDARKYELSLKYALFGVKCIFDDNHEKD